MRGTCYGRCPHSFPGGFPSQIEKKVPSLSAVEARSGGRGRGRGNTSPLPRYDQALNAAKNSGRKITLSLAISTSFTDEEGDVFCQVCEVDKYSVKIKKNGTEREFWIAKAMIVGTEIHS